VLYYTCFYIYEVVLLYIAFITRNKYLFHLSVIIAILFSGLRFDVGVDYNSYVDLFKTLRDTDITIHEPLTIVITRIGGLVGESDGIIFLLYAMITISCVVFFVVNFSPFIELSLFLFLVVPIYYLSTFNGVRQWAAIAMVSVSMVFFLEKKYFKTFFSILFASMFHMSAFIMLLIPFFKYRYSIKKLLIFILSSAFLSKSILEIIVMTPYGIYLWGMRFEGQWSMLMPIYIGMLFYLPYRLHYFDKNTLIDSKVILMCNMCLASAYILFIGYILKIDFLTIMRINSYFIIQMVIIVPMQLKDNLSKFIKLKYVLVLTTPLIYLAYTLFVNGDLYVLTPYKTIFWP
jgi:hypothetical protein